MVATDPENSTVTRPEIYGIQLKNGLSGYDDMTVDCAQQRFFWARRLLLGWICCLVTYNVVHKRFKKEAVLFGLTVNGLSIASLCLTCLTFILTIYNLKFGSCWTEACLRCFQLQSSENSSTHLLKSRVWSHLSRKTKTQSRQYQSILNKYNILVKVDVFRFFLCI